MPNIPNFLPSRNGLQYANSWSSGIPDKIISTPFGKIKLGDASNGLCGGMVFAVADLYHAHHLPPPSPSNPQAGSPAFNYLVDRLLDSFNLPSGVAQYYEWMNLPTHDTWVGPKGTSSRTINDSMPILRKEIDGGHPCPLGLVCVHSSDPTMLGHNHQVLAWGYDDQGSTTVVRVYDPNHPGDDDVTITFDHTNPSHTTAFRYSRNETILGFFTVPYTSKNPLPLFEDGITNPPGWRSPTDHSTLTGEVEFIFEAFPDVDQVHFSAYYATNPANISTVDWRELGAGVRLSDGAWALGWDSSRIADQGNVGWGTVKVAAVSLKQGRLLSPTMYRLFTINNGRPPVGFLSPAGHAPGGGDPVVGATANVAVYAPGASRVELSAYWAANPSDIKTVAWRPVGAMTPQGDGHYTFVWHTASIPNQGNAGWGTVNIAATPTYGGAIAPPHARFYQRVRIEH